MHEVKECETNLLIFFKKMSLRLTQQLSFLFPKFFPNSNENDRDKTAMNHTITLITRDFFQNLQIIYHCYS